MTSAEHSVVADSLLPPLFRVSLYVCVCGGGGMVGPCFVVHYLVSSLAITSLEKKESWLFYFNCLLMSFDN